MLGPRRMAIDGLVGLEILPGNPDFLDLPWTLPMARWREATTRIVDVPRGIARHEVLFLQYNRTLYAAKELPPRVGEREYEALRWLEQHELPAVHAAGHARVRREGEETSLLFTRFLENSIPFRTLFESQKLEPYRPRLLDAIAGLLVRLHLAGFFWGDCSLSNTLFRRDAGQLQAYLVDAETAETHAALSAGQRLHDLELLQENVAGDLLDLAAMLGERREEELDQTPSEIRTKYEQLWAEVTREEWVTASESWRIHERIRSLNTLGFTVGEVKLEASGDGSRLRMRAIVTDRDYHQNLLHDLTGLNAEDHQAQLMVQEIQELRATLDQSEKRTVPLQVAAYRWLTERYQPTVRRLAGLGDPSELYCELLENKWYLSECAGHDVGMEAALEDYLKRFAPPTPRTSAGGEGA